MGNIAGNHVYSELINSEIELLDIRNYKAGIYFLQFINEHAFETQIFIKE